MKRVNLHHHHSLDLDAFSIEVSPLFYPRDQIFGLTSQTKFEVSKKKKKEKKRSFLFVGSIFMKFMVHRRSKSRSDIIWIEIHKCHPTRCQFLRLFLDFFVFSSVIFVLTLLFPQLYLMVTKKHLKCCTRQAKQWSKPTFFAPNFTKNIHYLKQEYI